MEIIYINPLTLADTIATVASTIRTVAGTIRTVAGTETSRKLHKLRSDWGLLVISSDDYKNI